jgi:hypothetical protein
LVLGHALDLQAIHGGKAKHDTSDAQQIAVLLRGDLLPQASGAPAERRATRALLRRRLPLTRTRAERLAHLQTTNRQYPLPELGQQIASKANREGVAERFPAPAVPKSLEGDLALLAFYDQVRREVAWTIVQTAQQHDAQTLDRLQSGPGIGKIVRGGLRYALHALTRFPRVQAGVSSCRWGTCAKAAAGTRSGTAGAKLGHSDLTWAF